MKWWCISLWNRTVSSHCIVYTSDLWLDSRLSSLQDGSSTDDALSGSWLEVEVSISQDRCWPCLEVSTVNTTAVHLHCYFLLPKMVALFFFFFLACCGGLSCDHGNHRNHIGGNNTGANYTDTEFPELYSSSPAENRPVNEEKSSQVWVKR